MVRAEAALSSITFLASDDCGSSTENREVVEFRTYVERGPTRFVEEEDAFRS